MLEIYGDDEYQDLAIPERKDVDAGIDANLRALLIFDSIYTRPSYDDGKTDKKKHWPHPFYSSFSDFLSERKKTKI